MPRLHRLPAALATIVLLACDQSPPLAPSAPAAPPSGAADASLFWGDRGLAIGHGRYDITGLLVDFSFGAVQLHGDKAVGSFRVFTDQGDGLIVDFSAIVTCLAIDPVNHRAWVGGIVVKNRSTDAAFRTEIHRPGHDIWFRVLDVSEGDRSTFVGFEGAAGFATSKDYCAGRPWPDANARTWPVVEGGIAINP
jgi:hypothetical protein